MSDNPSATSEVPYQGVAAPPSEMSATPSGGGGLLAVIERLATTPNLNIDVFERLLAARRGEEDRFAERAFNAALSAAKGEIAPVLKTHEVDYASKREGGARTKYKYESFADVARAVDPVFAKHGLSYRFSVVQTAGDMVTVSCVISHADGWSQNTALQGKIDPGGTGMSMVQALGAALTYLQRYSLRAAIGLAAAIDDDGRSAGGASPKISVGQANELQDLIDQTGRSQVTLMRLVGVDAIDEMTVEQWTRAKEVLEIAKAERKRAHAPGN